MDEQERACWVAFNQAPGIATKRFRLLLDRFGTLRAAWAAPRHELMQAGLDRRVLDALEPLRRGLDPEQELARVRGTGASVITWQDTAYPARLAAIPDPPPVLYVRGQLTSADDWALAMVGTRRATYYGRDVAERLASELAAAGVTIVSGMAKGIDTHAHRGALAGGGRTIAVLGTGIDVCYPPENRRLATEIAERGALVTEYPLGVEPLAENFPPRNRIISGLAAGVLVVEAGKTSGALITSRFAAEQGRDVFAVPGPITSPASAGCHGLIQDGAKLVAIADDVLWELNPHLAPAGARQLRLELDAGAPPPEQAALSNSTGSAGSGEDDVARKLLALLRDTGQPVHVDHLARECAIPVHEVSGTLALLEIQGQVRHLGGMRYAPAS
ncbi:MAG: DNA-protecting protein DprA [Chloroflexi bacterium]|nr:DNA-protecting protein DprA [Chloroflexota bacterium]